MTTAVATPAGHGVSLAKDLSEVELALVGLLQLDGRANYSTLGRELGIAPRVAARLTQGLIDRQVIKVTAVTVPAASGYRALASVLLRSDGRGSRLDTARRLFEHEAVDYAAVMSGPADLMVNVVCRDLTHLGGVVEELLVATNGVSLVEVAPYLNLPLQRPSRAGLLRAEDVHEESRSVALEEVDRRILARLVEDGREPYLQIANALQLSESYVRQRVQRMTDSGAVQIRAIVDPRSLGYDVQAWVTIEHTGHPDQVVEQLAHVPAISFVAETAGSFDMFVEVLCRDMGELRSVLTTIRAVDAVRAVTPHLYFDLFYKPMRFA